MTARNEPITESELHEIEEHPADLRIREILLRLVAEVRRQRDESAQGHQIGPGGRRWQCEIDIERQESEIFSANVEIDNLRKQLTDEKAKVTLYDRALHDTLGSLHVINARARTIVKWIKDPNLKPDEEAAAIVEERGKAHTRILQALDSSKPVPMCRLDALEDLFPPAGGTRS